MGLGETDSRTAAVRMGTARVEKKWFSAEATHHQDQYESDESARREITKMATIAKAQAERSITTATQRIKLSVTAQLATGETKSWSLLKPVTLIGFRRQAQIIVREEHVNRSHAAIVNTGAHVLLVDLFTDAGTYCNGRLVTRELLKDGDVVRVGSTDLQIAIELPPNPVVPRRGIMAFEDPLKMPRAMRLVQVDTDERWEIVDSTAIIGNCKQAAVCIPAEGIARAHSLIFATINGIGIMDLGSGTPLKINGNEKQMAYLRRQDRLLIGKAGLMVQFPKAEGSAQVGGQKGSSENTTANESSGGSMADDVGARSQEEMEDDLLVNQGIEARAAAGSAAAVMDSSKAPSVERPKLESLGSKISALQEELAESWGEINDWKKKLSLEHNNLTVREQEWQNKEKELGLRAAEVEQRCKKVADQEQQRAQQQREIAAREAELEKVKEGLNGRDVEIREQRSKLTTVASEMETRQQEYEQQQLEIAAREAELEKANAGLEGRNLEIREQQDKLATVASELETRQKEVERFSAEYDTVRQEIEAKRLEIETLENSIAEERSRLEKAQQSMSELSEETERKSQELSDRESKLSSEEETILQQRADLESNLRELETKHEEIGSRESQLIESEKALQKRHSELVERERQIHHRSEIVTRFKQFIEEANEAYDITVNSPVDPPPETIPVLPEPDATPAKQPPANATAVLDRARREMRAAVSDLEEETRQMAEGLPDSDSGNEEPSSAGVDLKSLEPEVRDRFRALKRIGSNGKSDEDLIEQIRAELLKEGHSAANKRRKKKAWWKG